MNLGKRSHTEPLLVQLLREGIMLQKLTAIHPYETLLAMYEEAVNDQPWSYLFINLKKPKEEMFSIRFDEILQVEGKEEEHGRIPLPNSGQAAGRR